MPTTVDISSTSEAPVTIEALPVSTPVDIPPRAPKSLAVCNEHMTEIVNSQREQIINLCRSTGWQLPAWVTSTPVDTGENT